MKDYKHKWKYEDDERPKGQCYDCKMKYKEFPDMTIEDDLWELINPTNHKGAGILCPTCISNRLDYLGLWYNKEVAKMSIEDISMNVDLNLNEELNEWLNDFKKAAKELQTEVTYSETVGDSEILYTGTPENIAKLIKLLK